MGLDAHVFCNCLQERNTTEPPICREMIYIHEDGIVEIHYPENMSSDEKDKLWHALDKWSKNCCKHKNMHYCNERIGNWSSVRELQQAITEQVDRFPTLASIFPSSNGGQVDAQTAYDALRELSEFCQNIERQTGLFLTDAKTGTDLYAYVESYDGIISWDGRSGKNTGFDFGGLFVIDSETKQEHFRSMHFSQKFLPNENAVSPNGEQHVITPALLTDIASGNSYRVNFLIGQDKSIEELRITTRHLRKVDFYSIEPLENILKASIETGNSIFWC